MALNAGKQKDRSVSQFYVTTGDPSKYTANGSSDSKEYLFSLFTNVYSSTTFYVNSANTAEGTTVELPVAQYPRYHVKLIINGGNNKVDWTISDNDNDGEVIASGTYITEATSTKATGLWLLNGRNWGRLNIDNIKVYTGSGNVPQQPEEPEEPTVDVAAQLVHTASSSCGADAEVYTSTVDGETEHVNNATFNATWQGAAYMEFALNIPEGGSIKKAILKFNVIGESRRDRDGGLYYVNAGETIDYAAMTAGDAKVNLGATNISTITFPMASSAVLEINVTAAVKAMLEAGQNYVIFKVTGNPGGGDISGKASDLAPELILSATGITTGIEEVTTARFYEDGAVYNLRGQKVGNSTEGLKKGLYIVNGKKVVIR